MKTAITREIIHRLHTLDEPKLVEVLDFVEFLAQRERAIPQPPPFRRACGAMQGMLSSVDEFSARKDESILPN